jgi:glycosidase
MDFFSVLFPSDSELDALYGKAAELAHSYNELARKKQEAAFVSAGKLHAVGVLHMIYQTVLDRYLADTEPDFFTRLTLLVSKNHATQDVLAFYVKEFPSPLLSSLDLPLEYYTEESLRGFFVHQVIMENPAMVKAARPFVRPEGLSFPKAAQALTALLGGYTQNALLVADSDEDIFTFLTHPARLYPDSLTQQIRYIATNWEEYLPHSLSTLLLRTVDYIEEEEKPRFFPSQGGQGGPTAVPDYSAIMEEYEAFSADRNWMPNVVMIAKSTLVWLDQLTKQYGYPVTTLADIPDRELDLLHARGFTALWLIGLWERSNASKKIKNLCGNKDAEASAYSLKNYEIAESIGGWPALENLRSRCADRNIRLASDMVPNHCGIDGDWVFEHGDYFVQQDTPPFPSYTYEGPDLSDDERAEIKIEDHYYDRTDAAVAFRRRDRKTGKTTYIFHGNDGTSMPWNDTAQLDYLNPETREAVYRQIKHVAQNFPIIRFDAAMTLAKKHIQRLWYPAPGQGGDIAGRASFGLTNREFNQRIEKEFWREVVDRLQAELPDTLLLAEAFWMMEGYFVRTLGMHRVYNSAFMNMLKNQENAKYRETIKQTLSFEPEILKRFVNFMNNPDEDTAIAQFGDGDRYFGVCTLLATMPGLPMFGHGQIEGYREKYGMEYRRAYWDEKPDERLVDEHGRRIFPLLRKRYLFSGIDRFAFFDLVDGDTVHESAFCYVNGTENELAMVLYNNRYEAVDGWINASAPKMIRHANGDKYCETVSLAEAIGLTFGGRQYLLYRSFEEKKTYIRPSLRVFDEGMHVHLRGFETRVLLDLREVEDIDGAYGRLYAKFGDSGIADIAQELAAIRLEPVYKVMEPLHGSKFRELIEKTTAGKAKLQDVRKMILILAEAYTHLAAVTETLHPSALKTLPNIPQEIDPTVMLEETKRFTALFSSHPERGYFRHGAAVMDEFPSVVAASLFLKPFVRKSWSIREAMEASDRLLLQRFYASELDHHGFSGAQARKACHEAAILATAGNVVADPTQDPKEILAALLEDESLRTYANCNEYQGIVWYRKEAMQEIIFLTAMSMQMLGMQEDTSDFVRILTEAETGSGYQLDKLLG